MRGVWGGLARNCGIGLSLRFALCLKGRLGYALGREAQATGGMVGNTTEVEIGMLGSSMSR